MHRSLIVLVLVLATHGIVLGQTAVDALERVQEIKILQSDRHDVRRILADFVATDDDGHYQEFSMGDVTVGVSYSSGTCSEDSDNDDANEIWKISEWKVTRIEIVPDEPFTPESVGLDMKGLMKEQRYANDTDSFIHHNKKLGIAFETDEDGIGKIILFPPAGSEKQLCKTSKVAKKFYSAESWFGDTKLEDRTGEIVCSNDYANVTVLELSSTKILATSGKTIAVTTTAVDPENDVLTYNYTVSAGQIRGTGPKVTWDLTGIAPGTYTITAGVDDGCGICGKTETKSVVIE